MSTYAPRMPLSLWGRLNPFSSQGSPKIKAEENSNEMSLQEPLSTSRAQEEEDMPEQDGEWNGFGDEVLGEGEPANATISREDMPKMMKKKKKKKKKKGSKSQSEHAAEGGLEVETPQLGDDNSLENSPPNGVGESTVNGHLKRPSMQEYSMVESSPASKRSKKINGVASKKKRSQQSKAGILTEEEAGVADGEGHESAGLLNGWSEPPPKTKNGKPRKSRQAALEPDVVEPEQPQPALEPEFAELGTTGNVDTETRTQDLPVPSSSEVPPEVSDAKKYYTQEIADEPVTKSQQADTDSAVMVQELLTPAPVQTTPIQPAAREDFNLAASSQLQGEARSTAMPQSVNGENAEDVQPKRTSKKALGKRKAIDEPFLQNSNKKTKRAKDRESLGRDLRTFGFLPSDEVCNSPYGSATSKTTSMVLIDSSRNIWEESNGISLELEPPSKAQTILKSPRPSWNAINNPIEHDHWDKFDHSLFIPDRKEAEVEETDVAPKASGRKHSLPIDEPGPSNYTPSAKSRTTPAKSRSKTPKTPKDKAVGIRAVNISKVMLPANELDAITAAVESYRELCNITQVRMNEMIQSDASGKFAQEMWKAICDEVPDVPRRRVISTCRRKFHNFEARGAWTEEQDDELKRAYDEHPGKWKLIGETLNRFPEDCRDRWRNYLVCGDTLRKDAWDLEEEKRLRAAIKQCIREAQENNAFAYVPVSNEENFINWQKVSELMGRTRSRLQCRDKWIKIKGREEADVDDPVANQPISETWRLEEAALQARLFSAEEKLTLLKAIRDTGAVREGKIPWQTIKNDLDGKGKRMGWKYCFRKLKEHVDGHEEMKFKDIVAYLVGVFENAEPNEPDGFDLPIETLTSSQTADKRKTRGRPRGRNFKQSQNDVKQPQNNDTDGEASAPQSRSGRLRDRMLQEGESQETAISQDRDASVDIGEDVAQGFELIKRTPKSKEKRGIRKSKRNQTLSEEKVIESDDEEPLVNGVNEDEMDMDHEGSHNPTSNACADYEVDVQEYDVQENDKEPLVHEVNEDEMEVDHEEYKPRSNSALDDDEIYGEEHYEQDDEEDTDMSAGHTNGRAAGSPDLDTPVKGRAFPKKLDSPIHFNGYPDEENGAVSSDGDMSDIPAVRRPKMESVEL